MKNVKMEKLILEYVKNNITEEVKEDFINAAVHFIVNEDSCSKYDIMRIKYRFKKIKSNEIIDYIKLCSTYVYIIYRSVVFNLVEESMKSRCCEVIMEISNEITKYVTMESDELELHKNMELEVSKLCISDKCNAVVLEKFKDCHLSY